MWAGNELQLTDALLESINREELMAIELSGSRYDIGDKFGYLKAIIEIGLKSAELRPQLLPFLFQIVEEELQTESI